MASGKINVDKGTIYYKDISISGVTINSGNANDWFYKEIDTDLPSGATAISVGLSGFEQDVIVSLDASVNKIVLQSPHNKTLSSNVRKVRVFYTYL